MDPRYRKTIRSVEKSCWTIIKLVLPISIAVDVLHYFGALALFSRLFAPITAIIGLPPEAALALAGGGIFNLYTGIALAAPLNLTAHQWTIVAVFLGLFHSIILEAAVLKKLHVPYWATVSVRLSAAILCSFIISRVAGGHEAALAHEAVALEQHGSFSGMLLSSVVNATTTTLKIMALIAVIVAVFDLVKSSSLFGKNAKQHSWAFDLAVGLLLGVTYGAGLLLNKEDSSEEDRLPIAFFLVLCHGIIEETALFTMFGAQALPVVMFRLSCAILAGSACYLIIIRREHLQGRVKAFEEHL